MTERPDPRRDDGERGVRTPPGRGGTAVSAAERQRTCAACGGAFRAGERTEIEVLLDGVVRYVAVHPGHSTFPRRRSAPKAA